MSAGGFVSCPAGAWTRICQWPAPFGFVYVSTSGGAVTANYRVYSAGPPHYFDGTALFGSFTPLVVGPTPYVELWVNPVTSSLLRVT